MKCMNIRASGGRAFFATMILAGLLGVGVAAAQEPIKVGTFLSVTGPAAFLGDPEQKTLELYIERLNAAGGVLGRKLELLAYDSGGNADKARTFARRLIEQNVDPRKAGIDWGQFREAQREPARSAVASALVLDELARRENLAVLPEDVDKEVEQFAARSGRTPAAVRAQLEKEAGLARLAAGLRREKAVDFAMSRAKMTTD